MKFRIWHGRCTPSWFTTCGRRKVCAHAKLSGENCARRWSENWIRKNCGRSPPRSTGNSTDAKGRGAMTARSLDGRGEMEPHQISADGEFRPDAARGAATAADPRGESPCGSRPRAAYNQRWLRAMRAASTRWAVASLPVGRQGVVIIKSQRQMAFDLAVRYRVLRDGKNSSGSV